MFPILPLPPFESGLTWSGTSFLFLPQQMHLLPYFLLSRIHSGVVKLPVFLMAARRFCLLVAIMSCHFSLFLIFQFFT